jgi:hypothetical protein
MIRGDQIYVRRTRLNLRILQHPLMALRPGDASKNNCGLDPHGTLEGTAAYCA